MDAALVLRFCQMVTGQGYPLEEGAEELLRSFVSS